MSLVARLEKWLSANNPNALATFEPAVDVAQLEAALGSVRSAATLLELYAWRNGQPRGSAGIAFGYSLPTIETIFESKTMLDEMAEAGEWDDDDATWKSWWVAGWVPFFDNGSGDFLCIDTVGSFGGPAGQVIEFLHDSEVRTIVAPSFDAWFESWVAGLEAKQWSVDAEGWTAPADDDALEQFLKARMPGYPKEEEAETK